MGRWDLEISVRGFLDGAGRNVGIGFEVRVSEAMQNPKNPNGSKIQINSRTAGIGIGNKTIPSMAFSTATGTSTQQRTVQPDLSGDNQQVSGIHFDVVFGETVSFDTDKTLIRCDNDPIFGSRRLPGCVNVYWSPNIQFSISQFPNISPNISDGQAKLNGLGAPGIQPLIRANTNADSGVACSDTRTAALIGPRPDPVDGDAFQCDEYPFASSTDGGRPDGVIKWVPGSENSRQGARLSGDYSTNRIMAGDQFYAQP